MSRDRSALLAPSLVAAVLLASAAELATPALAADPQPSSAPAAAVEVGGSSPLHWHPPGEEQVLADREGKPILYFFTADWCAPCHQMKRTLFADPEKASHIAASFVPVEVQDTRRETGANAPAVDEAQERYAVNSLPTLVVALPDGSEVAQQRGYSGTVRTWLWLQQQAAAAEERLDDR
ncbi:MAG TPA: thioredoxin family protein [Thermoanaerobaculia bacterium]|nr:thioredoxin family protein [Thermoanaerobaculia bacterium]